MAVCVSLRMHSVMSRDPFKPIRLGENVVVNYLIVGNLSTVVFEPRMATGN